MSPCCKQSTSFSRVQLPPSSWSTCGFRGSLTPSGTRTAGFIIRWEIRKSDRFVGRWGTSLRSHNSHEARCSPLGFTSSRPSWIVRVKCALTPRLVRGVPGSHHPWASLESEAVFRLPRSLSRSPDDYCHPGVGPTPTEYPCDKLYSVDLLFVRSKTTADVFFRLRLWRVRRVVVAITPSSCCPCPFSSCPWKACGHVPRFEALLGRGGLLHPRSRTT